MFWSRARNVLIFLFTACLASLLLSTYAPRPRLEDYTNRLAAFEDDSGGFDVITIGSSRVMRGFVPEVFDQTMSAGGAELRSFNFGLPASGAHEWVELLPEVIARSKRPLKWVIVELNPNDRLTVNQTLTDRMTHWHSPGGTAHILQSISKDKLSKEARFDLYQEHLRFAWIRNFSVGRGPEWLAGLAGRTPALAPVGDAGWVKFDPTDPNIRERRADFVSKRAAFSGRIGRARAGREELPAVPLLPELVSHQVRAAEAAGARVVFIVMPPFSNPPSFEGQEQVTLLEYNDAETYPELFVFENFHDRQHLSSTGAKAFTRLLAADLLKLGGDN